MNASSNSVGVSARFALPTECVRCCSSSVCPCCAAHALTLAEMLKASGRLVRRRAFSATRFLLASGYWVTVLVSMRFAIAFSDAFALRSHCVRINIDQPCGRKSESLTLSGIACIAKGVACFSMESSPPLAIGLIWSRTIGVTAAYDATAAAEFDQASHSLQYGGLGLGGAFPASIYRLRPYARTPNESLRNDSPSAFSQSSIAIPRRNAMPESVIVSVK